MTEIERAFYNDSYGKKNVARSARNKRTHTGKGGRVRLPSDYLTKKELEKMNGECKAYRLNGPMAWQEFKSMPDDIKATYIKMIREKFGASTTNIADMLGVTTWSVGQVLRPLGLADARGTRRVLNEDAWNAWLNRQLPEEEETRENEECESENESHAVEGDTCVPDENRPDWEDMYKALHARCKELQDQNIGLQKTVDELREENADLMERCGNKLVDWDYHRKLVDALEKDNEILRAKMSVVEMIFNKR